MYSKSNDISERHKADKILEGPTWERIKVINCSKKEEIIVYAEINVMKVKRQRYR